MSTTKMERATRRARRGPPQAYPAEKARQGEIILNTKWRRRIFLAALFGGLALLVVFAILARLAS